MTNEDKPTTEDRLDALARRHAMDPWRPGRLAEEAEARAEGCWQPNPSWQRYVDEVILRRGLIWGESQPGPDSMHRAGDDTGDIW